MVINLTNPAVWANLERQAYEGTVDLLPLPPAAYKYFSELTAVYRAFRFEGMPKEDAENRKRLLRKDYERQVAEIHRVREVFAEYQRNVRASELCRTKIEKAEDAVTIAVKACEAIEAMTGETGFAERQKRKIYGSGRPISKKEAYNERDMLDGNLNRMSVTDSLDELVKMYTWAVYRLEVLRRYNTARLEIKKGAAAHDTAQKADHAGTV